MLSTYQGYLLYTREPGKALQRAAVQTVNARAEDYYRENIGKVETVDEFLDDHGLYSYAMKAYGLEEMTYAKAFMRKVLTSDLSDEDSFANTLSDTRYRDLADAFRFDTAGKVIKNTLVAQTTEQTSETLNRFKEATPGLSTVFASIESADIINSITAL